MKILPDGNDGMPNNFSQIFYDDPVGMGVLVHFYDTAIFDLYYRRPGGGTFRQMLVIFGYGEDDIVYAECIDPESGLTMSFSYLLGSLEFLWNNKVYEIPDDSPQALDQFDYEWEPRQTEYVLTDSVAEILIIIRSNADNHKESLRRLYVGNDDGSDMHEASIIAMLVRGGEQGTTFLTSSGSLFIPHPERTDQNPEWNGQRLHECYEDDFVIEERHDSILVGVKW